MKNPIEIKDDIVLVHINSRGINEIAILDRADYYLMKILGVVQNRLNIDTAGFVQHRKKVNGEYNVFQLHRVIANAFETDRVGFRNGNKLDLRRKNLFTY